MPPRLVCGDLRRIEAGPVWPVGCSSCSEAVTLAAGLRVTEDWAGAERRSWWVAIGDADLLGDVNGRFGACAPVALRAFEQALVARAEPAASSLGKSRKRLLAWLARRLPYRLRSGYELPPLVELRLHELGRRVRARGGKRLYVTSGTRGPYRQARAMYIKLMLGSRLVRLYRAKQAVRAIVRAYRRGRRAKQPARKVIARMQRVIERQVCRGIYVSEHLKAGAVDLRSRGLRWRHRRALRRAVRSFRGAIYLEQERHPPHFHLAFRRLGRVPTRPTFCPLPPLPDLLTGRCETPIRFLVTPPPVSRLPSGPEAEPQHLGSNL